MAPQKHLQGIMYAAGSAVFNSTFGVFAKYLLQFLGQSVLMAWWFTLASVMALLVGFFTDRRRLFSTLRQSWKAGLLIGVTNVLASVLFFTAVNRIGPSAASFLSKLDVVFVVLIAFVFLRERLNKVEVAGMVVALAGSFFFAFSQESLTAQAYWGVLAALAVALNTVCARWYSQKVTQKVTVSALQIYRTLLTASLFMLFLVGTGQFVVPGLPMLFLIAAGAFCSAVVGVGLFYVSLKHIKASAASIIRNVDPFLVALYAYPVFHTFPSLREWIGGIILVAGVTLTALGMSKGSVVRSGTYSKLYKKLSQSKRQDGR